MSRIKKMTHAHLKEGQLNKNWFMLCFTQRSWYRCSEWTHRSCETVAKLHNQCNIKITSYISAVLRQ